MKLGRDPQARAQQAKTTPGASANRSRRRGASTGPGPEAAADMLCQLKDTTVDTLAAVKEATVLSREVLEEVGRSRSDSAASTSSPGRARSAARCG